LSQSERRQPGEETASDSFYLTILDAEACLLDQSWFPDDFRSSEAVQGFKDKSESLIPEALKR
jgi:hypothetical protein